MCTTLNNIFPSRDTILLFVLFIHTHFCPICKWTKRALNAMKNLCWNNIFPNCQTHSNFVRFIQAHFIRVRYMWCKSTCVDQYFSKRRLCSHISIYYTTFFVR